SPRFAGDRPPPFGVLGARTLTDEARRFVLLGSRFVDGLSVAARGEDGSRSRPHVVVRNGPPVVLRLLASKTLAGRIRDLPDGWAPRSRAWIYADASEASTHLGRLPPVAVAADGTFRFEGVAAGRFKVYIRTEGRAVSESRVVDVTDQDVVADVGALHATPGLIFRRVRVMNEGAPVGGAFFSVRGELGSSGGRCDADGWFEFPTVAQEVGTVEARWKGLRAAAALCGAAELELR
ncbi:MAG TPA: hypothetical protein VEI02_07470, partial [Planctomycetota bacterium]|nr:hypothetical protein [Planctomycetota bacterium]